MIRINCSVLVSTCDKYQNVWPIFFRFFKEGWSDCPYKVYMVTETKKYIDDTLDINILNFNRASWSVRLKKALKKIDTEYVILLLEDFFLTDHVMQDEINHCLELMDNDKQISVIDFEHDKKSNGIIYGPDNNYCERQKKSMYFLNCQASIWRRKDLIRYLSPYEDPWQFEQFGSKRVPVYGRRFLLSCKGKKVFEYDANPNTGYGCHYGKWLKSNIKLFEKNDIKYDFSDYGFFENEDPEFLCKPPKVTIGYRLYYFIFSGGGIQPRMTFKQQFCFFLKKPVKYLSLIKFKTIKCTSKDFFDF